MLCEKNTLLSNRKESADRNEQNIHKAKPDSSPQDLIDGRKKREAESIFTKLPDNSTTKAWNQAESCKSTTGSILFTKFLTCIMVSQCLLYLRFINIISSILDVICGIFFPDLFLMASFLFLKSVVWRSALDTRDLWPSLALWNSFALLFPLSSSDSSSWSAAWTTKGR